MFRALAELRRLTDAEIEERIDAQLEGGRVMMTITLQRPRCRGAMRKPKLFSVSTFELSA